MQQRKDDACVLASVCCWDQLHSWMTVAQHMTDANTAVDTVPLSSRLSTAFGHARLRIAPMASTVQDYGLGAAVRSRCAGGHASRRAVNNFIALLFPPITPWFTESFLSHNRRSQFDAAVTVRLLADVPRGSCPVPPGPPPLHRALLWPRGLTTFNKLVLS
jgi:hypothetical protein